MKDEDALRYHSKGRPGKIEVVWTKPVASQLDLSLAYTPGVAAPCREIAADPANGIAKVLDARDLERAGAFPNASFGVEFAPGFYFAPGLRGPLLSPGSSKGTHGYLPERPEMHASCFIVGPGIASGRDVGVIDMRRIAPTLARILGIELPGAAQPPLFEPSRP